MESLFNYQQPIKPYEETFISPPSNNTHQTSTLSSSTETLVMTGLVDPNTVLVKYHNVLPLSKIGRLSVKLARESFFGCELMKSSTVFGCSDKPPLPRKKLEELKQFLIQQHPNFRSLPIEFESHWKVCIDAINHACATVRAKANKI